MITITNILDVEKHLDAIDTVIFDLDDTLYSEKDYVRSGFNAVAEAFPEEEKSEVSLEGARRYLVFRSVYSTEISDSL